MTDTNKVEPVTITDDERKALERFQETTDDGEGYDVPKEMMRRLAKIGVVHHTSGGIYGITDFGHFVLGNTSPASALAVLKQQLDATSDAYNAMVPSLQEQRDTLRTQLAAEQTKVRELVEALQRVKRHIPVGSASWEFADIAIAKYGEQL